MMDRDATQPAESFDLDKDAGGHGSFPRAHRLDPEDVPLEPGAVPIPPGMIRGYHYTDKIDEVLRGGLDTKFSRGSTYGEPNVLWFSASKPGDFKNYIEVHLRPEELGLGGPSGSWKDGVKQPVTQEQIDAINAGQSDFTVRAPVISAERIITFSKPWHSKYRALMRDYPPDHPETWRRKGETGDAQKIAADRVAEYLEIDDPEYVPAVRKWADAFAKATRQRAKPPWSAAVHMAESMQWVALDALPHPRDTSSALMDAFLEEVEYAGETRPWQDVPETDHKPDDDDDPEDEDEDVADAPVFDDPNLAYLSDTASLDRFNHMVGIDTATDAEVDRLFVHLANNWAKWNAAHRGKGRRHRAEDKKTPRRHPAVKEATPTPTVPVGPEATGASPSSTGAPVPAMEVSAFLVEMGMSGDAALAQRLQATCDELWRASFSTDGEVHESLRVLSADGSAFPGPPIVGTTNGVGFTDELHRQLSETSSSMVVHTHPSSSPLSIDDLHSAMLTPQMAQMVSIGRDGALFGLSCDPRVKSLVLDTPGLPSRLLPRTVASEFMQRMQDAYDESNRTAREDALSYLRHHLKTSSQDVDTLLALAATQRLDPNPDTILVRFGTIKRIQASTRVIAEMERTWPQIAGKIKLTATINPEVAAWVLRNRTTPTSSPTSSSATNATP